MTQEMLSQTIHTCGHAFRTGGNQPIHLTDPTSVWFVAHGHVDVFTSRLVDDQPLGTRNYFFTAGQGELLFGINHGQQGNDRALLAVPSPNAEIISIGIEKLKEMMVRPQLTDAFACLLDTWIGHLSQSISRDINPPTHQLIDISNETKVEANLKIRSKKGIVWVEFLSGNALFLGMKEIMEPEVIQKFPVSQDSWLYSLEASTIRSFKTSDICLQEDVFVWLENFYEVIFFCDFFNSRLHAVDEFNGLKEKTA